MKKSMPHSPLNLLVRLLFAALLTCGACSGPQKYFTFSPAPAAYVKKPVAAPVNTPPATTANPQVNEAALVASAAPAPPTVLPEVAALQKQISSGPDNLSLTTPVTAAQTQVTPQLSLPQKIMLHKIKKQAQKLSKQSLPAESAAGPVSNRNAIALVLIGLIVAVLGSFLGGIFYTLGVLILLVGLVLLVLNYV